jgi:hypothetical protein
MRLTALRGSCAVLSLLFLATTVRASVPGLACTRHGAGTTETGSPHPDAHQTHATEAGTREPAPAAPCDCTEPCSLCGVVHAADAARVGSGVVEPPGMLPATVKSVAEPRVAALRFLQPPPTGPPFVA